MQENLWGTPQCTKGWDERCSRAISPECTCNCGGHNHGSAKSSVGEPIKIIKQTLFMRVEVYKKRGGYVASGTHNDQPYSFAALTPVEAIGKAVKYIQGRPTEKKLTRFQKDNEQRVLEAQGA